MAVKSRERIVPVPPSYQTVPSNLPKTRSRLWKTVVGLLCVLFLVLLTTNKGWIVAATVNGKPIFSWQLNSVLRARYGQQTLEGMIGELLIGDEAQKAGITITPEDVAKKQQEVLNSLGADVNLDDFLKFQGMNKDDFTHQLVIQLQVERLLTKGLTVSDADIANFIATNSSILTATDPAKLKEEARAAIINNAVSEKLQSWFTNLRTKAAVVKFL